MIQLSGYWVKSSFIKHCKIFHYLTLVIGDKPKYTSGSWLWVKDIRNLFTLINTNNEIIAMDCYAVCKKDRDLIAAAPDMLEALETILEAEMSGYKAVAEYGGYVLDDDVRDKARVAIAKAKGVRDE